jgi:hypothetical protein
MSSIKHHLVSDDCSRFAPTNAVKRNQYGLTHHPRAKLASTKVPAIMRIFLSIVIASLLGARSQSGP